MQTIHSIEETFFMDSVKETCYFSWYSREITGSNPDYEYR